MFIIIGRTKPAGVVHDNRGRDNGRCDGGSGKCYSDNDQDRCKSYVVVCLPIPGTVDFHDIEPIETWSIEDFA